MRDQDKGDYKKLDFFFWLGPSGSRVAIYHSYL